MVKRLPQKIAALFLLTFLVPLQASFAEGKFVPYKEAKASLTKPTTPAVAEPGSLTPEELRAEEARGKLFIIFDARVKNEYDTEHLVGAKLPRTEAYYRDAALYQQKVIAQSPDSKTALKEGTKDIPRDAAIITYCHAHCGLSKNLKLDLEGLGFTNVRWLVDGIDAWRDKGYPLEKR